MDMTIKSHPSIERCDRSLLLSHNLEIISAVVTARLSWYIRGEFKSRV